ncbi:JmjC domain [Phytophthora cactorum]|nr:JmjC domain [Phytophthora cactorum]
MVRRSSMIGDVGRLTFADVSQLDAAETISGYKLTARELELLDRVSRLPFPKKYTWFLERMGALLRPWEEARTHSRGEYGAVAGIQPEHIHFPLRIEFVGEAGIDAGGLQREWFSILFGRLLDDELGLFMTCHRHTQAVAINPHSEDCTADHLLYFRGIGRLLGRALLEGQTMQARLCLPILKHFLGTPITFSDLQYVDPEVYTSMLWIRDNDGVDALELTFCVTELRADDEVITIDLVPDGRDKPVTDANKVEFLHLKLRYLMLDRYAPQLQALSLGLFEIIPQEALLVFDYQELELVLCGMPEIDMADWKSNTVVAPSFSDAPLVVDWFWEVIQGFTEDERARFLQFSTGSSRVPVQGFKGLTSYDGRICPFSLRPLPNQTRGFPKVHTCFNRVELPLYTTKIDLETALYAVLDMEWTEFSEEDSLVVIFHRLVSFVQSPKVKAVGKKPTRSHLRLNHEHAAARSRQAVDSLADTLRQLMNTMAAAGLGADSPSPRTLPLLAASPAFEEEEKDNYVADDEDEVDNTFDYIPPVNELSESSEDFGGDDERKEADEDQEQSVERAQQETDGSVTMETSVERQTVIQDTTVVKKYAQVASEGDAADDSSMQQSKELVAGSVSTSAAVISQELSSTLPMGRGVIPSGGGQESSNEDIDMDVEIPDEIKVPSDDEDSDDSAGEDNRTVAKSLLTIEKEQLVLDEAVNTDLFSENIPNNDIDEAHVEKSDEHEEDQQTGPVSSDFPAAKSRSISPASSTSSALPASTPAKSPNTENDSLPPEELAESMEISSTNENEQRDDQDENMEIDDEIVAETLQSAANEAAEAQPQPPDSNHSERLLLKALHQPRRAVLLFRPRTHPPPRDQPAPTSTPDINSSPKPLRKKTTVAPVHTPKQSKRAASKKRTVSPAADLVLKTHRLYGVRRGSRTNLRSLRSVSKNSQSTDVSLCSQDEKCMTCKHCGKELAVFSGVATRHLQACPAFPNQEKSTPQMDKASWKDTKTALPLTAPAHVQPIKPEVSTSKANDRLTLVQLLGSEELANKVKGSFLGTPFVGHAPVSRFEELIRNDVTGLRHLNVQNLLDAMDADDGPAVQLHPKLPGVRRSTGAHVLEPVSNAKARDLENCPLRFPAPRNVAEHFITPLVKELGLEYAMARHSAKIVSCPREETVLDWQFHRPETVVFLLSGKAMWRTKKSQVEYPADCFHPDSWQLEDVAHIAKVHRVSSMEQPSLGILAPPGDDFDVFDENLTVTGASEERQEHLLKSGSVLYLPAGVWFETETQGVNTLWLEVQLDAFTYEELVFSALRQLGLSDKQWRMRLQLYPGDRHQIQQARHHIEGCIRSLSKEMTELDGGDVLPEYLGTEDMQELVAGGLVQVTNKKPDSTSIAVDLTNPRFKLKHAKVFRDAAIASTRSQHSEAKVRVLRTPELLILPDTTPGVEKDAQAEAQA